MTTRSPLSNPESWDLAADGYAVEAQWAMAPFSRRALQLARLDAHARVLDVAAGPGTLTLELATHVASVTAVDFADAMNEQLRTRAKQLGLKNVRVLQADGQALPFGDGEFNAGFSLFGWMFFPDRAQGLAELHRVLVPGAPLVVSSWVPIARSPLMAAMFGALRATDPSMPMPVSDPNGLENPDVLARELRAGGFCDVAVHEYSAALAFEDTNALWTRMIRSSAPLVMLRKRLGERVWADRSEVARAHLARELGQQPPTLTTAAWLGVGRRGTRPLL